MHEAERLALCLSVCILARLEWPRLPAALAALHTLWRAPMRDFDDSQSLLCSLRLAGHLLNALRKVVLRYPR